MKQDVYISIIKYFIQFYLCFISLNNFSKQNYLILQQNWLYIKKKIFIISNDNKTMYI